jgi:hypothetical protein
MYSKLIASGSALLLAAVLRWTAVGPATVIEHLRSSTPLASPEGLRLNAGSIRLQVSIP